MLVKDEAQTPGEIKKIAQLAANRMSVTLLIAAKQIEQGRDCDSQAGIVRNVAKQLQEHMTEWTVS